MNIIAEAHPSKFDIIIADEAHRTACSREGVFGLVLNNEAIPAKKRLFLTATRRIFKGEHLEYANSMCDEEQYGPVVYSLNFRDAIKQKLVSDYRIIIAGMDEKQYNDYRKHFPTKIAKASFKDATHLGSQVMLLQCIKDYGVGRIISFHSRIYKAALFAEDLHKINNWVPPKMRIKNLGLYHISSRNSVEARNKELTSFDNHSGPSIITNARCLSEGVDLPDVDTIIFADSKKSQIDIIQAVGRAIRRDPENENKIGTIIIPVIVPDDADENTFLNHSDYKAIWHVVNAMSTMDERLAKVLHYHSHAHTCSHEPDGEIDGELLTHTKDGIITSVSEEHGDPGTHETIEPEWMQLIRFKLPTRITQQFCKALKTKIMHPSWKRCWFTREEAIQFCVDHNIVSYDQFRQLRKEVIDGVA